jgi:hypothetical protein
VCGHFFAIRGGLSAEKGLEQRVQEICKLINWINNTDSNFVNQNIGYKILLVRSYYLI